MRVFDVRRRRRAAACRAAAPLDAEPIYPRARDACAKIARSDLKEVSVWQKERMPRFASAVEAQAAAECAERCFGSADARHEAARAAGRRVLHVCARGGGRRRFCAFAVTLRQSATYADTRAGRPAQPP